MGTPKTKRALEKQMTTKWPVYSKLAREHYGKGKAEDILCVLESRGLSVTEQQRVLVEDTDDLALLNAWLRRAALVASTEELLNGTAV